MFKSKTVKISQSQVGFIVLIAVGILLPFGMNLIWAAGGYEIFYWAARFFLVFEKIFVGLVFIGLPFISLSKRNKDESRAISWINHMFALGFGIAILVFSFQDAKTLLVRWTQECAKFIECIK